MTANKKEQINNSPELLAIAVSVVRLGLRATYDLHEKLGIDGLTEVHKNEFGDTAMRGDIESEEKMIEAFRDTGISTNVHSEEHGNFSLNEKAGSAQLTVVIDGLDGSSVYKTERGTGRYGTMFAILLGNKPLYADYLAAGVMEHSSGRLVLAAKGKGLEVINQLSGETNTPKARQDSLLARGASVFVDAAPITDENRQYEDYIRTNVESFERPLQAAGYKTIRIGSSASSYVSVVTGEIECFCEATRKGNLELATGYALINEAGGLMLTLNGEDLGTKEFLTFGVETHEPVFTATNNRIARQILRAVSQ